MTAAGVTPEILEAAPSVGGLMVDNFSTTLSTNPFKLLDLFPNRVGNLII